MVEDFFSRTAFVVVGPASEDGVEFTNKSGLSIATVLADNLFEFE